MGCLRLKHAHEYWRMRGSMRLHNYAIYHNVLFNILGWRMLYYDVGLYGFASKNGAFFLNRRRKASTRILFWKVPYRLENS